MFIIVVFVLLLLSFSCKSDGDNYYSKQSDKNKIILQIDSLSYSLQDIDREIEYELYDFRYNYINSLISRKLIELEAEKYNLSPDNYIELNINTKINNISRTEIMNYLIANNIDASNETNYKKAGEYLLLIKRKKIQSELIDSLSVNYKVWVLLKPPERKRRFLKHLYTYITDKPNTVSEIYFIYELECPNCQVMKNKIDSLKEKLVKLKICYVPYGANISFSDLALEAAYLENKYWDLSELFREHNVYINDTLTILKFLRQLDIDSRNVTDSAKTFLFKEKLETNAKILSYAGIYSVPTIIINGKILPDNFTFREVEKEINLSLKKIQL